MCIQSDKNGIYKVKKFRIRDTSARKDEYCFVIIAIYHNKTGSYSLTVLNVNHNHITTPQGVHLTYQNLARTNKIKDPIILQSLMRVISKQIIAPIWNDGNRENPLVKLKDIYNECEAQRQKQLDCFTLI